MAAMLLVPGFFRRKPHNRRSVLYRDQFAARDSFAQRGVRRRGKQHLGACLVARQSAHFRLRFPRLPFPERRTMILLFLFI